jgi:hypothetical protein
MVKLKGVRKMLGRKLQGSSSQSLLRDGEIPKRTLLLREEISGVTRFPYFD